MATQYTYNGTVLDPGQAFTAGGVAYPANWLELASDDDLAAHDIIKTEVADPAPTADEVKAALSAYADRKQAMLLNGGVTVNGVPAATDVNGRVNIAGAVSLAQLQPDMTFHWVNDSTITLTADQIIALGQAVGVWVQDVYTALGNVLAGIAAGTITTTDEIDAASWPSTALS
jgi:hypothetical protein